jgi:hypothetical protein
VKQFSFELDEYMQQLQSCRERKKMVFSIAAAAFSGLKKKWAPLILLVVAEIRRCQFAHAI